MTQFRLIFCLFSLMFSAHALYRIPLTRHKTNRTWSLTVRPPGWTENLRNMAGNSFYMGTVYVGNPPQKSTIDFDTGSDMLFLSCNCAAGEEIAFERGEHNYCFSHNQIFAPSRSRSNVKTTNRFSIQYGSGFVAGTIMFDRVCLPGTAHCSGAGQKMLCASFTNSGFENVPGNPDSDGLMGLAYGMGKMGNSAIRSILNQDGCANQVFAFYLSNAADKTQSEMTICGWDNAKYEGKLHWLGVTRDSYYWTIQMSRVAFNGATHWSRASANAIILDTGTTGIYLPGSLVNRIRDACVGCTCPTLIFTLNGIEFRLPGSYYVDNSCSLLIFSSSELSFFPGYDANWILGDAFLRAFYSVFDYKHGRVALAPRRT